VLSISLLAAFPELTEHALGYGVTGRAREQGLWRWRGFGLHDFAADARKSIDARPAAGGPGMVLLPGPLDAALAAARDWHGGSSTLVFLSPDGEPFNQARAREWAHKPHLTFVAGRYEGIDQRWIDRRVDAVVSIGDYVLSGGELAAAVVVDSCIGLLPGALGDDDSAAFESFAVDPQGHGGRLDWPQYALTQAEQAEIPAELRQGDHATVQRWRLRQALARTWMRRPDLLARVELSLEARAMIDEIALESKAY